MGKWDSWRVRGQGPPRPCPCVSEILGGCGGGRGQRPLPSEVTLAAARPLGALPREASDGSVGGSGQRPLPSEVTLAAAREEASAGSINAPPS